MTSQERTKTRALNNFRSTWDHTNLHLEHVTGNPAKHFTGAIFAERFEAISRGRFFVGNISVTYTKGTEKDTIDYERALTIVSEWMNHPANRDRLPKANR